MDRAQDWDSGDLVSVPSSDIDLLGGLGSVTFLLYACSFLPCPSCLIDSKLFRAEALSIYGPVQCPPPTLIRGLKALPAGMEVIWSLCAEHSYCITRNAATDLDQPLFGAWSPMAPRDQYAPSQRLRFTFLFTG